MSYAADFVYLSTKDKSQRDTVTAPNSSDVNSKIC